MDTELLKKLGLTEQEVQVYLASLRLGEATASIISKETNIDRATTYRYLDSLISKGLISYVVKNNVKYYIAANPHKILEDLQEKQREYKNLLPQLISLSNLPKEETKVEVYKGKDGLKTVLREIVRLREDHVVLGDEGDFLRILPIEFTQFIKGCEINKIKERILTNQGAFKEMKKHDYKYSQTRALPSEYAIPTTTIISKNKIILFNWVDPYNAIVISNKDMAKAYKNYFEILWKTAKS